MDFVNAFGFHRRYQPDAMALFFPDAQKEPATYAAVETAICNVAVRISNERVARGDVIGIEVANDFFTRCFCLLARDLALSAFPVTPRRSRRSLL